MLTGLRKRGVALLAVILTVAGLGIAVPALATEESSGRSAALETPVGDAMLTKVVDGQATYDIGGDSYTFVFTQKLQGENEELVNLDENSAEKAPIASYTITNPANTVLTLNTVPQEKLMVTVGAMTHLLRPPFKFR